MDNKPLPIYGNGKNIRDWLYVEDNCKAIDYVLHAGKYGEIYNISAKNEKPNLQVVNEILKKLDKNKNLIRFVKDRPGHDFRYSINCQKIKRLGWKPKYTFNEALEKIIEWYLNNETWWRREIKKAETRKFQQKVIHDF